MCDTVVSIINLISYWQMEVLLTLIHMKHSHQQTGLHFRFYCCTGPIPSGQRDTLKRLIKLDFVYRLQERSTLKLDWNPQVFLMIFAFFSCVLFDNIYHPTPV